MSALSLHDALAISRRAPPKERTLRPEETSSGAVYGTRRRTRTVRVRYAATRFHGLTPARRPLRFSLYAETPRAGSPRLFPTPTPAVPAPPVCLVRSPA